MKNVSIAQRITLTLAIALLSMIGVGGYALWGLGAAQSRFEYVQVNSMPSVKVLSEVIFAVKDMRTLIRDHILSEGTSAKNEVARRFAELQQLVEKDFERYEKELTSDENDKKLIQADRAVFATYVARNKEVMEKSLANDMQGAHKLLGGLATQMNKAIADHIEYNWKLLEDTRKANQADYNTVKWVQIVAILLAFAVSGALGYAVIQEIRTRMNRLSGLMTQVNETLDFTTRIPITRLDELGLTGDAFNKLLDKMQGNLKTIAEGARSVAASANAMAATVEEMTVSINHVADRAQEANRLSSDSGKLASDGEKIIGQTARDIQDIAHTVNDAAALIHGLEQHSQQIANVVQVIKDVADQTNLLALNAAIEAARAGEQGRGFAVVADEVRKLAERTASSTQEIAQTIDAMRGSASNAVSGMEGVVSKVTLGVERAQEANAAIQQIGEGSRNAVGMVEEIAEAIREQGAATNNIASHVERIAQMSEESSAAAANSADAAQELDRLATEMQRIVSAYRL